MTPMSKSVVPLYLERDTLASVSSDQKEEFSEESVAAIRQLS
jgi:hypothetical protein